MSVSANDYLPKYSADKMRIATREAQLKLQEKEINRILSRIGEQAEQGHFDYGTSDIKYYEVTFKLLKALGYKIEEGKSSHLTDNRIEDCPFWIISWGEY